MVTPSPLVGLLFQCFLAFPPWATCPVWGSGISDADRHTHDDLPIILAGNAGGKFQTGRHVEIPDNTPLNNLYMRLLREAGASVDRIGDSSGLLTQV